MSCTSAATASSSRSGHPGLLRDPIRRGADRCGVAAEALEALSARTDGAKQVVGLHPRRYRDDTGRGKGLDCRGNSARAPARAVAVVRGLQDRNGDCRVGLDDVRDLTRRGRGSLRDRDQALAGLRKRREAGNRIERRRQAPTACASRARGDDRDFVAGECCGGGHEWLIGNLSRSPAWAQARYRQEGPGLLARDGTQDALQALVAPQQGERVEDAG